MWKRSRNRVHLNLLRTVVFCSLISLFAGGPATAQDPDALATNVVLLLIKTEEATVLQDPFFDLLELGDELLVPVNRLSAHLNLEVSYFRREEKVVLTNKTHGKWAIYLKRRFTGSTVNFSTVHRRSSSMARSMSDPFESLLKRRSTETSVTSLNRQRGRGLTETKSRPGPARNPSPNRSNTVTTEGPPLPSVPSVTNSASNTGRKQASTKR